jgi:hypothetical protein
MPTKYPHHCEKCGHNWESGTPFPTRCPSCKTCRWSKDAIARRAEIIDSRAEAEGRPLLTCSLCGHTWRRTFMRRRGVHYTEQLPHTCPHCGLRGGVSILTTAKETTQPPSKDSNSLREFIEFSENVEQKTATKLEEIDKYFGGSERVCFVPNVVEMECRRCSGKFDIYTPAPDKAHCPFCGDRLPNVIKKVGGR